MVFALLETTGQEESQNLMYTESRTHKVRLRGGKEERDVSPRQTTCFKWARPPCGDCPRHMRSCPQSPVVFLALSAESGHHHWISSTYKMCHILYTMQHVTVWAWNVPERQVQYTEGLVFRCLHDRKFIGTSGSDTVEENLPGYPFKMVLGLWWPSVLSLSAFLVIIG